jgi:single-strand DNA-binding protein
VFVARKIGHDLARTAYEVDRSPATARQTPYQLDQAAAGPITPPPPDAPPATPPAGATYSTSQRSGTATGQGIGL